MIKINGNEYEYVLNLNKSVDNEFYLTIDSRNNNGNVIPWMVVMSSNESIRIDKNGINKLYLKFNLELIKNSEFIIVENYNKERARIIVKPNIKESMRKIYVFSVDEYDITNKDTVTLHVTSKCNDEFLGWECSYKGEPYKYDIDKTNNEITITLKSTPFSDIIGLIELKQNKSNKTIGVQLLHHKKEKMEIYRID